MRARHLSTVAALACLLSGSLAAAPEVGKPAPALVVSELDGHVFDLRALRGKVVIVNFWATWCAPCRAEMPRLDAFYRAHRAQGVELIGLSVDDADEAAQVAKIMKGFSYPAALASGAQVNDFGPPVAVPTTWIIDTKGVARARLMSGAAVTAESLQRAVLPLLPAAQHP